jgi:uncharacterized protein YdhG (YjbR/CyaY superfamily)
MQSKAKDVATYIKQAPAARQEALVKLHRLCRQVLKGYEERMEYGGPRYSRDGTIEVGFASQKRYISLYILRQDALESQRPFLAGLSVGKGCIRYSRPEKIDFAVVERMLAATRDSTGEVC